MGTIDNATYGSLKAVDNNSPYPEAIHVPSQDAKIIITNESPELSKCTTK